ncbi:MAG TPA: GRP family sugar transporter, partial [Terriglobia bacterium]|nr:GRP family sugar transporter [Terriglobia bacterium]
RWTVPTVLKGTSYIFTDLREKPHLLIWAILAGALWAVANTLTVFAIRDVGLSIAFPLWNTNSLVGVLWGWLFFKELRGGGAGTWGKVLGGAVAIVLGATLVALGSQVGSSGHSHWMAAGIVAALGAGLLWGTMYIPYRKAYVSGMNPLSFVTVFTVGELGTMTALALAFEGGLHPLAAEIAKARPALFWLFLGGFFWVIGDLFQQYAAKYIGIGRGIPLSNTNQLWGLAWGVLVFGELKGLETRGKLMVIAGSLVMILGAVALSAAVAPETERESWREAVGRECRRYGLDFKEAEAAQRGEDALAGRAGGWTIWDVLIVAAAVAIFVWLAHGTSFPSIFINKTWMAALLAAMIALLLVCGRLLWKWTRFS